MKKQMIQWKLHELMAVKRKRNKELAEALGMTVESVSRLRKKDVMPRLSPDLLDGVCGFLECQPGDLLVYIPNNGGKHETT